MIRDSYGFGVPISENLLEDDTKCDEYRKDDENYIPARICKLKFFEDEGVKFISHKFYESCYVNGYGEFSTVYKIEAIYKEQKFDFYSTITAHNGVITYIGISWDNLYEAKAQLSIFNKLEAFFGSNAKLEE